MNNETICQQFLQQYYNLFDTNRAQCTQQFFTDLSTYSFEGETFKGQQAIGTKLTSLNIPAGIKRTVSTKDVQSSALGSNALVIFVTGELAGSLYQEVFQIVPTGNTYYVHNGIFRVNNANAFNCADTSKQVSQSFIEHFFKLYDTNRVDLKSLYSDASFLTHEGQTFNGAEAISGRFNSLPQVKHDGGSFTVDVHEVKGVEVLFMLLTGKMSIEGSSNPVKFVEVFQLLQQNNSYFIGNHLFRLNYGG
eukprot:maker-scaffold_7-snap-gene-12.41-mRNA-1 protein AED:0.02 eAED:0.02 QI:28/1/1/1/1/1/2/70/248